MKHIVITGGCGFIGVNLIKSLTERKDTRILVIDDLSQGSRENLAAVADYREVRQSDIEWHHGLPDVTLVAGDICDKDLALQICNGADAVVHLAANTGVAPSIDNPREDFLANVIGTFNYLEATRQCCVKRFVFASSGAPLGEQVPPIHEKMVPRPVSPYGASKLCGEAYCLAYHASFGVDTVSLRFGNVYGPYSRHKNSVISKFIKHMVDSEPLPIYGDGAQSRDFVHVDDLIQAILLSLERSQVGGEIFQIATNREHTIMEIADEINRLGEKYLHRSSPIVFKEERQGDIRRNCSDTTKAKRRLGFECRYNLKAGLEDTFTWFLKHRHDSVNHRLKKNGVAPKVAQDVLDGREIGKGKRQ